MARSLPPLNGLRAFEAAARHLSFTRAAQELNVTQAAVSHQVALLEARLGVRLFRRRNRALMLTDAGQGLFPPLRDALDRIAGAVERVRPERGRRAFTVSLITSFAAKWLVPRISRFQERHPDVDVRVGATERLVDFVADGVDVAVRGGAGRWPGVRAELIAAETVVPVCSPRLLEGAAPLRAPSDLARVTLLHDENQPVEAFPGWAGWLEAAGAGGVDAGRGPRFSHTYMAINEAIAGRGVALGHSWLIADDVAAGLLVRPFDLVLPAGFSYYLACAEGAVGQPRVRAFRDWIFDEARAAGLA